MCYPLSMFRKAEADDIEAVCRLYDSIHSAEEAGLLTIGWKRGVYPTDETVRKAFAAGELFVGYDDGILVAAGVINRKQVDAYAGAPWSGDVPESEVMVLHTLAVLPSASRRGYGRGFVSFYESYARKHGCRALRMDTNSRNAAARSLYAKLGYREVAIVPTVFNGIEGVGLVLLEKMI